MMANSTVMVNASGLPPLPSYELELLPPLIWPIPDKLTSLLLPIIAYWILSMFFHWIDTMDFFPQYRLHTPAEVAKRNRVSRFEVVKSVVIQQVVQTAVGWGLGMTEPDDFFGQEQYDLAVWAQRIRIMQRAIPRLLSLVGIDALGLGKNLASEHPMFAGAMLGGQYPTLQTLANSGVSVPGFAKWETTLAWTIYYILFPAVQFTIAILFMDTWQYFLHRAMHMNKWLYSTFLHLILITSEEPSADTTSSHLPLPPPPSLRSLRLRCSLQSSLRGLPSRHARRHHRLQGRWFKHPPRNVLLHRLHDENC